MGKKIFQLHKLVGMALYLKLDEADNEKPHYSNRYEVPKIRLLIYSRKRNDQRLQNWSLHQNI